MYLSFHHNMKSTLGISLTLLALTNISKELPNSVQKSTSHAGIAEVTN